MKKLLIGIAMVGLLLLTGCSGYNNNNETNGFIPAGEKSRFVVIEHWVENDYNYSVIRDKVTNVLYLKTGSHGGITALLNDDGTPMLWDGNEGD